MPTGTQLPAGAAAALLWPVSGAAAALPLLIGDAEAPWNALAWISVGIPAAGLRYGRGGVSTWAAFGWCWGLAYFGGQFAWLHHTLVQQGGMGQLHFVNVAALLIASLALVPAAGMAAARTLWMKGGISPLWVWPIMLAAQDALLNVAPFGGLGWGSLAAPQAHTWSARLVVPALGGSGLVLLLSLVGAAWSHWIRAAWRDWRHGLLSRGRLRDGLGWTILTLACAWPAADPGGSGTFWSAGASGREPVATLDALMVPGDLSLETLSAERNTPTTFRYYLGRTLAGLAGGGELRPGARSDSTRLLTVWPESAVPGTVEHGRMLPELSEIGALVSTDFLLGSNAKELGREYNSLYLVDGGLFEFRRYDKQRLVPFGEYVPHGFQWLFPRKVTAGASDYAAGTGQPVLEWRGTTLGLAICFESVLPGHVAAAVAGGSEVLIAVANDAWLTPLARKRHLRLTALRALEVGRDVIFVANRGWSAHLSGGRPLVRQHWEGGALRVQVALRDQDTIYTRWSPWPLVAVVVILLISALRSRRRTGIAFTGAD